MLLFGERNSKIERILLIITITEWYLTILFLLLLLGNHLILKITIILPNNLIKAHEEIFMRLFSCHNKCQIALNFVFFFISFKPFLLAISSSIGESTTYTSLTFIVLYWRRSFSSLGSFLTSHSEELDVTIEVH